MASFKEENNHVLHVLIGAGFTSIILIYCIADGIRFLRSWVDKFLYLISCLLQKPILLPILLPSRFRSRIATKHIKSHTVLLTQSYMIDGKLVNSTKKVLPTNFLLAVQETNFLYSFTLSGFVASTTACTIMLENNYNDEFYGDLTRGLLLISIVQFVYGMAMSVYMYGRKTKYLFELY